MENFNHIEILLVEDNINDAELTVRALQKNNLTNNIHVVKDGEEALDYILCKKKYEKRTVNPRVILLDLKLPKISGIEVLKVIKSDKKTKNIPVVVLTSSKEEKDIIETYSLGVNSYIVKPVDFDKFVKAVAEIGLYWLLLNERPSNS